MSRLQEALQSMPHTLGQESQLSVTQLAAKLDKYANDIESEGRTYAPAIMREAAKRLRGEP